MRNNSRRLLLFFLLLIIPACNIPTNSQYSTPDIQAAIDGTNTAAAEELVATSVLETQLAGALSATLSALTPEIPQTVTPEPGTTTILITQTSSVPMLTVSVETYCRKGPGTVYDSLGILPVNQPAEVIARSEYSDDWLIKLPSEVNTTCWVYGKYATISGDQQLVPKVTPPPTPTPRMDFQIEFVRVLGCMASYALRFNVINSGDQTWESLEITFVNYTQGRQDVYTSDRFQAFPDYCAAMDSDLESVKPGAVAAVSNVYPGKAMPGGFKYDPIGDEIMAIFILCDQDGLQGTCLQRSIKIMP